MAAGIDYQVAAILQVMTDQAEQRLNRAGDAADRASKKFRGIAEGLSAGVSEAGAVVEGLADRVISFGMHAGMALGAAGIGIGIAALKTGLLDVNANLEDTRIGFGTIINTLAHTGLPEGLRQGAQLMSEIRQDAKDLPGEFSDFVDMAKTLTAPVLNAGKGIEDVRNLTRDTVVAAAALGIRFDQASREMAMLLEGHAGAHNVLGLRLGITTHTQIGGVDFAKASMEDRFKFLQEKLAPTKESLVEFEHSWKGMWSTIVDTGKMFVGTATAPLFDAIKREMERVLYWTGAHQEQLQHIAGIVGDKMVHAWDLVVDFIDTVPERFEVWRERFATFADDMREFWHEIHPIVEKVAALIETSLHHPTETLKLLATMKLGGMAAQALPGIVSTGFKISDVLGGGGAAEGAGEAAAGAAGGIGAGVAGAAAVAALAALVAVLDNVDGSAAKVQFAFNELMGGITDAVSPLIEQGSLVRDLLGAVGAAMIEVAAVGASMLADGLNLLGGAFEVLNVVWQELLETISLFTDPMASTKKAADNAAEGLGSVVDGIELVAKIAYYAISPLSLLYEGIKALVGSGPELSDDVENLDKATEATHLIQKSGSGGIDPTTANKPKGLVPVAHVDARGSHITLQLNVKDQDPDRIIRRVFLKMGEHLAHPISSSAVPAPGANF